jgi:AraC-like DNA-binding protein
MLERQLTFYCLESFTELSVEPIATVRRYMHTHPWIEVFLCTRPGWQVTEQGLDAMREDDLFIFPAGHLHIAVAAAGKICSGRILMLSEQLFSPLVEGDAETRQIIQRLCARAADGAYRIRLTPPGIVNARELLLRIEMELKTHAPGYKSAAKSAAQLLFLTMLREHQSADFRTEFPVSNMRERLTGALCYLQSQYMHPITVEQMLEISHMSRSQFHAVFKTETGMTLVEYLNALRLTTAAQLLRESTIPIAEIACRCGYSNVNYFYRLFTARYKLPPNAYRGHA